MIIAHTEHVVATRGPGLYPFTRQAARFVAESRVAEGLLTCLVQHTSASLTVQENADPDVRDDMVQFFDDLVPAHRPYIHSAEGPDDMPAHIKTTLSGVSLSIPIIGGALALGTWQGLYLFEHRRRPHTRTVLLHVIGR